MCNQFFVVVAATGPQPDTAAMQPTPNNSNDAPIATITPRPDADACTRHGCAATDGLRAINPHNSIHEERVLCPEHAFAYLEAVR